MFASSLKPKSDASEKNLGLATIRTALHWRIDDVIWCVETRRFVLRLHASSHPFLDAFRLTHVWVRHSGPARAPHCTHANPRAVKWPHAAPTCASPMSRQAPDPACKSWTVSLVPAPERACVMSVM